jgi:NAD(P)-dependent dehydrogenase (short-subunit alcohol dehydrogenase family)
MGILTGKKAFITGAEQGIGKESARKLIEAGCDIYIHYFSGEEGPQELIALAEQQGSRAACGFADLTNEEDAARCVARRRNSSAALIFWSITSAVLLPANGWERLNRISGVQLSM